MPIIKLMSDPPKWKDTKTGIIYTKKPKHTGKPKRPGYGAIPLPKHPAPKDPKKRRPGGKKHESVAEKIKGILGARPMPKKPSLEKPKPYKKPRKIGEKKKRTDLDLKEHPGSVKVKK